MGGCPPSIGPGLCAGNGRSRHLDAWAGPHQPIDDIVVACQALGDDAQAIDNRSERDLRFGRAIFSASTTSTNLLVCSVPIAVSGTSNTFLGGVVAIWTRANMPGVKSRLDWQIPRGRRWCSRSDRWRCRRSQPALVRIGLFIDKLQLDQNGQAAVGRVSIFLGGTRIAQMGGLIQGELETNRINRFDGRKQAGVARSSTRDEIANGHAAVTNAARDRGAQLGEFEIELCLTHDRLLCCDRRLQPRASPESFDPRFAG